MAWPAPLPGRLLEAAGNCGPRGMTVTGRKPRTEPGLQARFANFFFVPISVGCREKHAAAPPIAAGWESTPGSVGPRATRWDSPPRFPPQVRCSAHDADPDET